MKLKTARRFLARNSWKTANMKDGCTCHPSLRKRIEKCKRIIAVGEDLLLRKFSQN